MISKYQRGQHHFKTYFVTTQKSKLRITGSDIQIEIHKRDPTTKDDPWPRLTKDTQKYPWIKPDFDKMDISDDEEENAIQRRQVTFFMSAKTIY